MRPVKIRLKRPSLLVIVPALFVFALCHSAESQLTLLPKAERAESFSSRKEYLWVFKGKEFAKRKNLVKALELFSRAIQSNPKSPAHYWKGLTHEEISGEMIRSWKEFQRDSRKPKQGSDPALNENEIKEHCNQAILSYRKALEISPSDHQVHYRLGQASFEYLNDPLTADRHLNEAAQLNPEEPVYRLALARFLLSAGRFSDARKESENFLTEPQSAVQAEAHFIIGRIELEQRNYSKAIEELELSLSLNPGLSLVYFYLAKALRESRQFDAALTVHRDFQRLFVPLTLREVSLWNESAREIEQMEPPGGKKTGR